MVLELIQYFLQIVLNMVTGILKFFTTSKFSGHGFFPQFSMTRDFRLSKSHVSITDKTTVDGDCLRRDGVELLMADLGVFFCHGGEKMPEVLNCGYVFGIFEEEEPRLDEVKEAFDVFDENKDGFIDAGELQRVVSVLGLKERADIDDCRKMIGAFDENADGRIDFQEFVKFMENSFC